MKTRSRKVWVLGSKNYNADRYVLWNQKTFPNFHDPDILIINLSSLDETVLKYIDKTKFQVARDQIFTKFMNGGTVVYLISKKIELNDEDNTRIAGGELSKIPRGYSNYDLSPIEFQIKMTGGHIIKSYKE